MSNKIFNLTSSFKALGTSDDGSVMIRGMASTHDEDRANDVILAEAWGKGGLKNFENNPIILFNHNYDKPIGRATGLKITENGLELEAKISKSAPDNVVELVKEGILGAFSVGFRVKDADYNQKTDGLVIKDAELFEVSVVSVPCNQAATFSVAKSFDTQAEYEEFKKTFTNSVDLAGQTLAKDEVNASDVASDTPDEAEKTAPQQETKMDPKELEALMKKVAEDTAATIAMKQAEKEAKAAAEAEAKALEAAKAAEMEEKAKSVIEFGIQSGTEKLLADVEAKLAEKDAKIEEVVKSFEAQLKEKADEIAKMRESKRTFADRGAAGMVKGNKDLMHAHMLSVMTQKGFADTAFGREVLEKAGLNYATDAGSIAQEVSTQIEKEIQLELRTANLFREMTVNSKSTVIPLQSDTGMAAWQTGGEAAGNGLENRDPTVVADTYKAKEKILTVDRLISTTYMDNYVDEEVLVNLMPMLVEGVARAHARAVDAAIISGNAKGISGLDALAADKSSGILQAQVGTANDVVTAKMLVGMRQDMGVYGLNPQDIVYVVSQQRYYDLLNDAEFDNVFEVGSDTALKLTGQVGAVYGSPVVISDNFPTTTADGDNVGVLAVNTRNFIIPRLRGVSVEQDYEVAAQRRLLVATQHLGFDELFAKIAGKAAAVALNYAGV